MESPATVKMAGQEKPDFILYPEQKAEYGGKHWYSANWGDMHISSIAAMRWCAWDAEEAPGWPMFESLTADSEQIKWFKDDLANCEKPYKWVVMHFHMMNRGEDDPLHPTGIEPEVEFNDFRSFLRVRKTDEGLQAEGIQASMPESGEGEISRVFDSFMIEANK